MWPWLSYDFDVNVTAAYIFGKAKNQIKPGYILVLNDNLKVKDKREGLLPQLMDDLKKCGLELGVISA